MKPRRQVVIKGSSLPVLRILVRDGDPRTLRTDLVDTIEDARPMLAEAIAVLDLRERPPGDFDPAELVAAAREARVRLAAVLIDEPNARAALANLDLPIIEAPLSTRGRPRVAAEEPVAAEATEAAAPGSASGRPEAIAVAPPVAASAAPQSSAALSDPTEPTSSSALAPLYLTRPLRSGQRIYAQGRDAVVAAPTSRGSELIADGSIYAFGPIRGRVLAGASGNTGACIVATHLDAELVAIAGVYRTLESEDLEEHGNGPVSVTLTLDADGNERLTLAALGLSSSIQRR